MYIDKIMDTNVFLTELKLLSDMMKRNKRIGVPNVVPTELNKTKAS